MAKVYVKIDESSIINEINSDIFLESVEGYVLIDEGEGDRFAHAQGNYLEQPLCDNQGHYNYLYDGGQLRLLTVDEKMDLFPPQELRPDPIEELQKENHLLKAQVQALTDQGEFQDDLIAELAMIVYA